MAFRHEVKKVRKDNFDEPVIVSAARESTENFPEAVLPPSVVPIESLPDVKHDDLPCSSIVMAPPRLPRSTSTVTSHVLTPTVAAVTLGLTDVEMQMRQGGRYHCDLVSWVEQ